MWLREKTDRPAFSLLAFCILQGQKRYNFALKTIQVHTIAIFFFFLYLSLSLSLPQWNLLSPSSWLFLQWTQSWLFQFPVLLQRRWSKYSIQIWKKHFICLTPSSLSSAHHLSYHLQRRLSKLFKGKSEAKQQTDNSSSDEGSPVRSDPSRVIVKEDKP